MNFKISLEIEARINDTGNVEIIEIKHQLASKAITNSLFNLTESQKKYNYVAIGKMASVQLPLGKPIKAIYNDIVLSTKTHKTQINRVDGLGKILSNFDIGDLISVEFNPASAELTFAEGKYGEVE